MVAKSHSDIDYVRTALAADPTLAHAEAGGELAQAVVALLGG